MKPVPLSLVCVLSVMALTVQGKEPEWFEGSIVLSDNEVRPGEISMQAAHDLVLFRTGKEVTVFPAHKINSVFFYDASENINRRYVSVRRPNHRFSSYQLYEVVLKGEVNVLRKQKDFTFTSTDARDFAYYIYRNEELTPLRKFRNKIYPSFPEEDQIEITAYLKSERLSPHQASDIIQAIAFYNEHCADHQGLALQ